MLGDIFASTMSFIGGERANKANAKEAEKNRAFQLQMAQNAHQYEVEDLKKAGLNPILSAGGSGASASGGAQATMQDTISPAVSSALASKRLRAEIEKMQADASNTRQQEKNSTELTKSTIETNLATQMRERAAAAQSSTAARLNDIQSYKDEQLTPIYKIIGKMTGYGANAANKGIDALKNPVKKPEKPSRPWNIQSKKNANGTYTDHWN